MTATAETPARAAGTGGALLVTGIVLAALTEAIASTVLTLGRVDLIGDVYATSDEFAWLDVGYTAMKFLGFLLAPFLLSRFSARSLMLTAPLIMGAACAVAAMTTSLDLLVALRAVQGLAGGLLLIAGQVLLFHAFPREKQPFIQALFAMGSVVAPATLAPALEGWLIDSQSWIWIFLAVLPLSLASAGLLLLVDRTETEPTERRRFDPVGLMLIGASLCCLTYVLSQGARWDWFEEPRIVWLSFVGAGALMGFVLQQVLAGRNGLLDYSAFRTDDFTFAFLVSFVAGAALFGSAFLIPSFAVSVLAMTPTDAGRLLLPGGGVFIATLLFAAFLMQVRRLPPVATVPFGILMIMVAMWMLSRATHESGPGDMMAALLLRGGGLGFLFLSITLIAFGSLSRSVLPSGIAMFNTGRQLGGLLGVAALQTLINHHVAANQAVLGAHVTAGSPALAERLAATTRMLVAGGMDAVAAGRAATGLIGRAVVGQSTVIAFETAFNAVALLFVFAAPVIVAFKIGLAKASRRRARRQQDQDTPA